MHRRRFLQTISAAASTAAASAAPAPADTPIRLGFDTYSVRAFPWKAPQLLEYAAGLKLDTIQFSSLDDYESHDRAYLQKIKDQAARLNIAVDGGMGCVGPLSKSFRKDGPPVRQQLLEGLRICRDVGAKVMRCYMGSSLDRIGSPGIQANMEATIKLFQSVRSEALDMGVKIAIENHSGDMQAREVRTIIEESGKDFVGSNLDTGNPIWVVEDPFVTLEILAPYALTSHMRDSAVFETPNGAAGQWVAMGDGNIDYPKFVAEFRRLCPNISMQLEIITGRPPTPLPYLEADFWKLYPKMPAAEFARFVALAKSGHPFMGAMVIEDVPAAGGAPRPPVMTEALKEQQRIDLERSFEYCKKKLGIGINWRA